jgi:hypothetical protein
MGIQENPGLRFALNAENVSITLASGTTTMRKQR